MLGCSGNPRDGHKPWEHWEWPGKGNRPAVDVGPLKSPDNAYTVLSGERIYNQPAEELAKRYGLL